MTYNVFGRTLNLARSNSLQTDKHASTPPLSFLQARCPSCRPTNSVKALKGNDLLNLNPIVQKEGHHFENESHHLSF